MIKWEDNVLDYVRQDTEVTKNLSRTQVRKESKARYKELLRPANLVMIAFMVVLAGSFAMALPRAFDSMWKQQYEEPVKYIKQVNAERKYKELQDGVTEVWEDQ